MIKKRAALLLGLSLLMGLAAAWVANNWVGTQLMPDAKADANNDAVIVAAITIPFGQRIEELHVRSINMPRGEVPDSALRVREDVVGKIATQRILKGEILVAERFANQVSGSTLAAVIEQNKRAISVRVNDVVGVAGFLLPGNFVDIVATRRTEANRFRSETILQNIKVLAVDQTAAAEKNEPVVVRAVTLEMSQEEAETLVKGQQEGTIQLTLRNPLDTEVIDNTPAPPPKVASVARPKRKAAPPPAKITIIRGTSVDSTKAKL